jgi:hypothetical protein
VDAELGEQIAAYQDGMQGKQFEENPIRNPFDPFAQYGPVIGRRIADPSLIRGRKVWKSI